MELRRRIGYVIQNVGLFPHQSVRANVATVPAAARLGPAAASASPRRRAARRWSASTPPSSATATRAQLSGGQRQRVGVARALAADPPVLLMDEPFSADRPDRPRPAADGVPALQHEVRKTIVFVTHDIEEAVLLGDRIAVMSRAGTLEQYATPAELLGKPASPFVADFVGADRGLKRLAVTGIDVADLEQPPVVHSPTALADARAAMDARGRPVGRRPRRRRDAARLAVGASAPTAPGTVGDGGPPDGGLGAGRRDAEDGVRRRCCSTRPAGLRCSSRATASSAS